MPELPDITIYVEALRHRIVGQTLRSLSIRSPFLLRTFDPPTDAVEELTIHAVDRLGKRIVLSLEDDIFIVIHLMIAGRLRWADADGKLPASNKTEQARLTFDSGMLTLTEAGTKKRASLHILRTRSAVNALHRGGLDVLFASPADFIATLHRENRTLKRALTDPRLFDGIGNAYSDEILHAARLSPFKQTRSLSDAEITALQAACVTALMTWTERLRHGFGLLDAHNRPSPGRFPGPGEITAFRPDFAVHGRFGQPCPVCSAPIQRIVYAENECNYCPGCQTEGRILADRSLSRLLKSDWPRTLEELEDAT